MDHLHCLCHASLGSSLSCALGEAEVVLHAHAARSAQRGGHQQPPVAAPEVVHDVARACPERIKRLGDGARRRGVEGREGGGRRGPLARGALAGLLLHLPSKAPARAASHSGLDGGRAPAVRPHFPGQLHELTGASKASKLSFDWSRGAMEHNTSPNLSRGTRCERRLGARRAHSFTEPRPIHPCLECQSSGATATLTQRLKLLSELCLVGGTSLSCGAIRCCGAICWSWLCCLTPWVALAMGTEQRPKGVRVALPLGHRESLLLAPLIEAAPRELTARICHCHPNLRRTDAEAGKQLGHIIMLRRPDR
mmetsp:Transcript_61705/g.171038  ORF Transcript_61705/g.171038 Transcript_61705/m.171038 type:complete len:309 (+) Transcript_61705:296-1222(+)